MKSVLITFDQAHYVRIIELLDKLSCRGFSYFEQMRGRGSKTGEPHYGSHAWPSMCSAIITVVEDSKVEPLLEKLHQMDKQFDGFVSEHHTPTQRLHRIFRCSLWVY